MNSPAIPPLSPAEMTELFGQSLEALHSLSHTQRLEEKSQAMIYSMACTQMQAERFEQAAKYFQFLHFYAPSNADYLQGLGICAVEMNDWVSAASSFGTALYLEPTSHALALAWAEALHHIGMHKVSREILALVANEATAPEDSATRQRARLLLLSLHHPQEAHATA